MNDNQTVKSDMLAALMNEERHAPTITRFVAEHFSELVPDSDYFTHLVRDDVGGEMLPPLPEEVIGRLPSEFTRADAVRVGGEFGVTSRTVERYLVIWQKTNAIQSVSRGHYHRVAV